jgi:ADP-ribose pyrophosphatase YjhB (NUDIX family)
VVKEWSDVKGGGREPSKQWKLPGGLLDAGETFAA